MHRTNIYLTDDQERALDARARVEGTTRSGVLRRILDDALAIDAAGGDEIGQAFRELSESYQSLTAGMFDHDEDLRID
jgi:hypothetical protein